MNKKLFIVSLILAAGAYASDDTGIKLKESLIVSSDGFESTFEETTKNLEVITREDLDNQDFNQISDALNNFAGVTIFHNTFGSYVDLRGQGKDKAKSNVQVLVDGVNINPLDPAHGTLPLDSVPVDNIEQIEIVPGGGSVVYGDGTVGGIVNIVTKAEAGIASNYIKTRVGSDNERRLELGAGHKFNDNLLMQVDFARGMTDGYRDDSDASKTFLQGTINYKFNSTNSATAKYSRAYEKSKSPLSLTRQQLDQDRKQSGEDEPWNAPYHSNLTRDVVSLNYKSQFNDSFSFNLDVNYQDTRNEWSSMMEVYTYPWLPHSAQESVGTFKDRKFVVSPKLKYQYTNGELVLGIDYKDIQAKRLGDPGYLGRYLDYDATFDKKSLGAFLLNRYNYNKWEFTQGYRREHTSFKVNRSLSEYATMWPEPLPSNPTAKKIVDFSSSTSMDNNAYELDFNYRYSSSGNAYVRTEGGFRTPAPSELTDKDKTLGYLENNLKAEKYTTYELGMKDFFERFFVSATAFYTLTKDEIIQTGSMPTYWYFYNIGETERKGIELSSEQYFGKLTLAQGASLIDAKINSGEYEGNYIPGVPKYSATVTGTYKFTERLSSTLSVVYKDGYYLNESNSSGKVNNHTVTDLTVNYTMNNGVKIYAGITNLFNESYFNNVSLDSSSSDGKAYDPAAERRYFAGLNYSF